MHFLGVIINFTRVDDANKNGKAHYHNVIFSAMKRILLPILVLGVMLSSGCQLIHPYIVDWYPVNITIEAVDDNGNSIIEPVMPGMTLTFQGETYEVRGAEEYAYPVTKTYLPIMRGLLAVPKENSGEQPIYRLIFGEIDGGADMDEEIVLSWPDGTKDIIQYHCSNHREWPSPKCDRKWKLNGKGHEGSTFHFQGKKPASNINTSASGTPDEFD